MAAFGKARARARLLARSESGMAVPVALAALVASFALASAAVLSSVDVQMGSHRDQDAKSAIAAADAGASLALLRLNRFQSSITDATPCIGPAGEAQTATAGWCPATTVETVGGATYSYQISAYKKGAELSVVSTGTSGEVSRRVDVNLLSVNGKNVFADEDLIGQDKIEINGKVNIETDIGTNGSVIKKDASAVVCGDIRHGVGHPQDWTPACNKEVLEGEKDLPAIDPPENLAVENSNCRLVPNCKKNPSDVDTWLSPPKNKRTSTEPWQASPGIVNVGNGATLTMGGADYYVCGLDIRGETIMPAGSKIRIFIRKPSECGMSDGALQFNMTSKGSITSTGFGSSNYNIPVVYMLGPGSVSLQGQSGTDHLVLYAPESEIDIGGGATWIGMLAGKSMKLHGNPTFKSDPNVIPPEIAPQSLWQRTHYVECTGAAVSPPNAYC
jgi:hypothetical protein